MPPPFDLHSDKSSSPSGACKAPVPAATTGTFVNPILDMDFPDPALIQASDGYYYAYATQTMREGEWINIQVARSPDLIHWQHLGDALPEKPAWAQSTQDFWAPSVICDDGLYYLYYSATPDAHRDGPHHALAVATAETPAGPFADCGRPLSFGNGFEYIDPMAFDDLATGRRLLYWGSGFQPIRVQELAPDRVSFVPGSEPTDLIWPNPTGGFPRLVEASWIILHDGFYYLFYSGDNCCGPDAEYGVMVARSRSATGPFETLEQARGVPHSLILFKSEQWLAPGHNAVVTDKAGENWIVYHAIDTKKPRQRQEDAINSRRVLLMDKIEWRDGWPHVGTPTTEIQSAPAS